ncbi:nuclear transport factor 2 family protein [Enhygromyxa salina]|uniref:SnoaL-like domain protein n=1 Tax=Enhygromyxa salina TaxID=215803 RepID=A0A2S9YU28_9BACT|nr:nuclear transport factor 2 family protein [Enhygromyxa salina]PRQ08593.1 SnoaL-like domain protein [Enhygromyxa salina]
MSDTRKHDTDLNDLIRRGKALEGFEQYYADDVVMMENDQIFEGKQVNRERELEFFSNVEQVHEFRIGASAVEGDTSFCEQFIDVTFKDGNRMTMDEIAVRTWKDGKVVKERFVYKGL